MPANTVDILTAPVGMATAYPPATVAATRRDRAQLLSGFLPARYGRLRLAPLLKRIARNYGFTPSSPIHGSAVWLSQGGAGDRLLLFSGIGVYSLNLTAIWQQDERDDGVHSYIQLPSLTNGVPVTGPTAQSAQAGVSSVQFHTELIISIAGQLYRYYVDSDGAGSEHLYPLGLLNPYNVFIGSPLTIGATGAGVLNGVYSYLMTYGDEFHRESSPSRPVTTGTLSSNEQTITLTGTTPTGYGITYWNLYRLNPGASTYAKVAEIAIGTSSYTDNVADSVVNAAATAPTAGENDPPGTRTTYPGPSGFSNILCVWKDRLVLNDEDNPNHIQISNAGTPTQFSSLPLPTNTTDGTRLTVEGKGQNAVTGLANLGSLLAVFGHESVNLLYGDTISDFTLRPVLERGCVNASSVQRCENVVLFLSDDGVYSIGYENGYAVQKVSQDVDDLFSGWTPVAMTAFGSVEATSIGRPTSVQVLNSVFQDVTSFYSEGRYFLSFGDRTLCYDVQTGGWSDTGWGFLRTVSRYFSQMSYAFPYQPANAPETVFITLGGVNDFTTDLYYYTAADTPGDRDAPPSGTSTARVVLRPYDAENAPEARAKRLALLSIYGSTASPKGTPIGTVRFYADGQQVGAAPLLAGLAFRRKGALVEVAPPNPVPAEVGWVELDFIVNDIELRDVVCEYVPLN